MDEKLKENGKPTVDKEQEVHDPIMEIEGLIRRIDGDRIRAEVTIDSKCFRFWTHKSYVHDILTPVRGDTLQVGDGVLLRMPKKEFDRVIHEG